MEKTQYQRKLASPGWQKKRLEQLQRFDFTCTGCGSTHNELHVHHKYYLPNTEPQDYPDSCYTVLCTFCHDTEEAKLKSIGTPLLNACRLCCMDTADIEMLISQLKVSYNLGISTAFLPNLMSWYMGLTKEQRETIDQNIYPF